MMETTRRVTVKDVAARCEVSKALAAAVLSDAKCNIGCSAANRERILRAAKELGYHPNRLARSMRSGVAPLVALCLHEERDYEEEINLYIHDVVPSASRALQERGLEMIFVPYGDTAELKDRLGHLVGGNLVSGVITNFPPEDVTEVADFLKGTRMPFVMLGWVLDESVPCAHADSSAMDRQIASYAAAQGFTRAIHALARRDVAGKIYWRMTCGTECLEAWDFSEVGALWVALGEFTRRALVQEGLGGRNVISVENKRLLIQSRPAIYVRSQARLRVVAAAELLVEWMKTGKAPRQRRIELLPEDIEFVL